MHMREMWILTSLCFNWGLKISQNIDMVRDMYLLMINGFKEINLRNRESEATRSSSTRLCLNFGNFTHDMFLNAHSTRHQALWQLNM